MSQDQDHFILRMLLIYNNVKKMLKAIKLLPIRDFNTVIQCQNIMNQRMKKIKIQMKILMKKNKKMKLMCLT